MKTTTIPAPLTINPSNTIFWPTEPNEPVKYRVRIGPNDYVDLAWPYSRQQILADLFERNLLDVIRLTKDLDMSEVAVRTAIEQKLPQFDAFFDDQNFIAWAVRKVFSVYVLSETLERFSDALRRVCKDENVVLDFVMHAVESCADLNEITTGTKSEVEQRLIKGAKAYIADLRRERNQGVNFGNNFVSISPDKKAEGDGLGSLLNTAGEIETDGRATGKQFNGFAQLVRKPDHATRTRPNGPQTPPRKRDVVDSIVRMELAAQPLTFTELAIRLQAHGHESKALKSSLVRLGATRPNEGGKYSLPLSERIAGDSLLQIAAGNAPVKWTDMPSRDTAPKRYPVPAPLPHTVCRQGRGLPGPWYTFKDQRSGWLRRSKWVKRDASGAIVARSQRPFVG
jgi:hypothetical protein